MSDLDTIIRAFQENDLQAIEDALKKSSSLKKDNRLLPRAVRHGSLEVVELLLKKGVKNVQKALGSICYGAKRDVAELLIHHGASMHARDDYGPPILGCCEVLNPESMQICIDLADGAYDIEVLRECVAMVFSTYSRNPHAKHRCLDLLEQLGFPFTANLMTAFHRGQLSFVRQFLENDPQLLTKRYALSEIYPSTYGIDPLDGLHLTPLQGATLLHLGVAYHEIEMVEYLLNQGIDPNVTSAIDHEGFGGQTALFHTVVSYPPHDDTICSQLLQRGADGSHRATIRKKLRHMGDPKLEKMVEFDNVTAYEYAQQFQVQRWANQKALALLLR